MGHWSLAKERKWVGVVASTAGQGAVSTTRRMSSGKNGRLSCKTRLENNGQNTEVSKPYMCCGGVVETISSCCCQSPRRRTAMSAEILKVARLWAQGLGFPVLPEVNAIKAVRSQSNPVSEAMPPDLGASTANHSKSGRCGARSLAR